MSDHEFSESLSRLEELCPDPEQSLFGADSIVWQICRYSCSLWGGVRAGLLQLALPEVAQAVEHHSGVREDPYARLRRTFLFVSQASFGPARKSIRLARELRRIHCTINGLMPDGTPYSANSKTALFWVHATLADTSIVMYEHLKGSLSQHEKDMFIRELHRSALLMGLLDDTHHQSWESFQAHLQVLTRTRTGKSEAAISQVRYLLNAPFPWQPLMNQIIHMTKATLPEKIRDIFFENSPGPQGKNILEKILPLCYRYLPEPLQWMPPYPEALQYYQGSRTRNPLILAGNRIMTGQYRVFSPAPRNGLSGQRPAGTE